MKKFIDEKYAAIILQLAHKYKNENPKMQGSRVYTAMEKTLETMDMYVAWINNMGFVMYEDSIKYMVEYIAQIAGKDSSFPQSKLEEAEKYLLSIMEK